MGVVAFDWARWAKRYPEFGLIDVEMANALFVEAQMYCDNTDTSIVTNLAAREVLLWMLVAHIAALNVGVNGEPPSPIVGRVNNVSEGSVQVQATYSDNVPGSMSWFIQTKYGASFWAASAQYRLMRYMPGHQRNMDPYNPFTRGF